MVPHVVELVDRPTSDSTKVPEIVNKPSRRESPSDNQRLPTSGRLESLRSRVQDKGISERAFEILSASWRSGTEKAYSSAWNKWLHWCSQRNFDPFATSVGPVIEFLTEQFDQGKQYTTINSYRSALSATIPPIEGYQVGQHPLVCKFRQGIFNIRPPVPRYACVWDVSIMIVVRYIASNRNPEDLSLKELSKRLVVLLDLSNADRASDLKALDLKFRQYTLSGVNFKLPTLTKTRKSGPPKEVTYSTFEENQKLCPVHTLKVYEDKTSGCRDVQSSTSPLFISFRTPSQPVSSSTIARWTKELLGEAEIDTNVFKGHSVRTASASAAKAKGVSMKDIMATAGWSRSSTFEKFYNKPIVQNDYSVAILTDKAHTGISRELDNH